MSAAVRPMAITPNERYVYFQVSFFFGIVQYDLERTRSSTSSTCRSATPTGCRATEFLLDSAHHGLAMNPRGDEALRRRDDVGLRGDRHPQAVRAAAQINVGHVPYWSQSSEDGKYCFVSVAGDDRVAVISFRTGKEVARIKVGDHPQRMRTGVIRAAYLK